MGNSETKYLYRFQDPKVGEYDLSGFQVFKIDNPESEEIARKHLKDAKILFIDCEGERFGNVEHQQLCLVQVLTSRFNCFIFHVVKYPECMDLLKVIFENAYVAKVFHDCSGDASVLFYEYGICLRNVEDIQVAHKVIESQKNGGQINRNSGPSLSDLYKIYCDRNIPGNKRFNRNHYPGGNIWRDSEELTDGMVKYAVLDVLVLRDIFWDQMEKIRNIAKYEELVNEQIKRKIYYNDQHNFPLIQSGDETGSWVIRLLGTVLVAAVAVFVRK